MATTMSSEIPKLVKTTGRNSLITTLQKFARNRAAFVGLIIILIFLGLNFYNTERDTENILQSASIWFSAVFVFIIIRSYFRLNIPYLDDKRVSCRPKATECYMVMVKYFDCYNLIRYTACVCLMSHGQIGQPPNCD